MSKVSDFKMSMSIIRKICNKHKVSFVDVSVSFDEDISGTLFIGKTKNIAHTIFKIVSKYIDKSLDIVGEQLMPDESERNEFFVVLSSNLRSFMYGDDSEYNFVDDAHVMRLYQFPIVWLMMKNIVCPIYNKDLTNLKVICDGNAKVDIARYYKKEELSSDEVSDESFIFVNIINNRIVQNAFIFIETLVAYDLSPMEVVKKIYGSDLYSKYKGLLDISLEDEEVYDFEAAIMENLGVNFYSMISHRTGCLRPNFLKTAQNSVPGLPNQFWNLGLIEQMLEPTRGADWTVYKNLEPYVKEFWDKVESVRLKRIENGHDNGVPFDSLLRIKQRQTVGYETDPTKTLQELLSSDRVW